MKRNLEPLNEGNLEKKGICKVLLKLCLLWLVIIGIFFFIITPQYKHDYSASVIDKIDRANSINSPKIILIGNSNVCYGFRCDLIEKETGYQVVNLGVGTFVDEETMRRFGLLTVNEGDIVVECPTTFSDNIKDYDPVGMWTIIENHFDLWKFVPVRRWPEMIVAFPTYMLRCLQRYDDEATGNDNVYLGRKFFDKYGDCVYCDYYESEDGIIKKLLGDNHEVFTFSEISDSFVNDINELNREISNRGGTFVIAGYPIVYNECHPNQEEYVKFNEELRKKVDCQVISNYYDYLYPDYLFYDSLLHLGTEGAKLRTMQLVEDLRNSGVLNVIQHN